jgi:hypothetical protein
MLRDLTAQGCRFARVRVVTMLLTNCSRFGVWCAQFTNGAGEDIRYLTVTRRRWKDCLPTTTDF